MAIISPECKCAICGEGFARASDIFATSGVFSEETHPLASYCDAPIHWDCFARWPHRAGFARAAFASSVDANTRNPHWGVAHLTDDVCVTVNPRAPVESVSVQVVESGSHYRILCTDWSTWLSDLDSATAGLHPLEQGALRRVWPELQARLPDIETVVANVDWDEKKRLLVESHAYNRRSHEERLAKTRHQNKDCRQMVRAGVACPFCDETVRVRYVDRSPQEKSSFNCDACRRPFGPVDAAMRDMETRDGTGREQ